MAETEPTNRPKRRLKAAPTMREQAANAEQKNNDQAAKPHRFAQGRSRLAQPFVAFGRLFHRQPFIFIGRILVPKYLRGSFSELRLVSWPSRTETRQLTFAVLIFAVIFGAGVAIVDYGLDKLFKSVLLK